MPIENQNIEVSMPWTDKSLGHNALIMNAEEFKETFLWGIPLCNVSTGVSLTDRTIETFLAAAQNFVETTFGIRLAKQYIEENKDFNRVEFFTFGYLKATWNILKPAFLTGNLNLREVVVYPNEWLTVRRTNLDVDPKWHNLFIVPNGLATVDLKYLAVSYAQWFSFSGAPMIPGYWKFGYLSGFEKVPAALFTLIGKIAAISVLPIVEQIAVGGGVSFGMASTSLSLDGMSQSASKANGGNIFSQRVKQYWDELKTDIPTMKTAYVGIAFDVA